MNVHEKLGKTRKPRVHITYDVETEGAQEKRELPFVVGVLGDYSGNNPGIAKKSLKDRKFVQIDGDSFDDVMSQIKPGVKIKVDSALPGGEGKELAVELKFEKLADFAPEAIIAQIAPLQKLLATRDALRDLLTKADRSDELEAILEQALQNTEDLTKLLGPLTAKTEN